MRITVDTRRSFLSPGYRASILYLRIHYYTVHHIQAQCKIFKVYMYMYVCDITSMCVTTCVCVLHVHVHVHVCSGIVNSVYS